MEPLLHPALVTIELADLDEFRIPGVNPLLATGTLYRCELMAVIDELADLRVAAVRFRLKTGDLSEAQLSVIDYAAKRKLAPVIEVDAVAGLSGDAVRAVAESRAQLSIPLDFPEPVEHDGIFVTGSWS
ncbi:MAG TPA: hypothetical protein VM534_02920, partial [Thermoanaerobaculia bacterium]|nr:hypothetical protein [Thermoanaerobaculia bacterium]